MTLLICEGVCNPALPSFDAAAAAYAAQLSSSGVTALVLDYLIAKRQTLRHTEHLHLFRNRYACGECGCERQYGPREFAMERSA